MQKSERSEITGSASAALWEGPRAKSMGKSKLTPSDIKIPEIFQI